MDAPWPALAPRRSVRAHGSAVLVAALPQLVHAAGGRAAFYSVEFFTSQLPNPHTPGPRTAGP